jgi:hypothetical protein
MFDSHETILGRNSNGPLRGPRTQPASPGSGERPAEGDVQPSVERGWRPMPRSYDWFGDFDPDGLPDGQDFLDGAGAPSEEQESP